MRRIYFMEWFWSVRSGVARGALWRAAISWSCGAGRWRADARRPGSRGNWQNRSTEPRVQCVHHSLTVGCRRALFCSVRNLLWRRKANSPMPESAGNAALISSWWWWGRDRESEPSFTSPWRTCPVATAARDEYADVRFREKKGENRGSPSEITGHRTWSVRPAAGH